ncbi:MAG: hypothetical protein IJJ33_15890 [Victivallales bacterium]|nr:hypothetical protein [Victivallales bacterium]
MSNGRRLTRGIRQLPDGGVRQMSSAYLRGFGRSLQPAIITLICVCGLRITWVYLLFPRHQSFGFLMSCYPFSWLLTAIIISLEAWRYSRTIFQQARSTP